MDEKQMYSKEVGTAARASSIMSPDRPPSPVSVSSSASHHPHHRDRGAPSTPHLPHHSSGAARVTTPTPLHPTDPGRRVATTHDPAFEVDFTEHDAANPRNWSRWYRGIILAVMSFGTTTSVMFSTSYTSAMPGLQTSFGISEDVAILGVTTYLLGLAVGALLLAPLSEMYGRRPVYMVANALFVVWVIPCAVADDMATILVSRFCAAFCASALISNAPGSLNDITEEHHRALAFSIWSIGPMNGPAIGPVVGGFVFQYLGWRWTNWVIVIAASVAWVGTSAVGETYAPAILRERAARKRRETGDARWWSRYDERAAFSALLSLNLSRPLLMAVTEPICIFWNLYIALVYGCLYLCFVAYPIIFSDLRRWSPGLSGLAFAGIGLGSMLIICGEPLLRRLIHAHPPPDPDRGTGTGHPPPEAMVRVVCLAAVLIPLGEIGFAWTGTPPSTPWILPILAGVPFGAGNCAVFIYATAYLVDSYDLYAASALAGNALLRSVMGALMPLAGEAMYTSLDPRWAGTLLAGLEAAFIPVPLLFYRYGARIRARSALIGRMSEDRAKRGAKRGRAERDVGGGGMAGERVCEGAREVEQSESAPPPAS